MLPLTLQHLNNDSTMRALEPSNLLPNSKKIQKKRHKYQRIDDSIREKLVNAVNNEGEMLKAAAKRLRINYSSAKSIYHTFRKEGRVSKKAIRQRRRKSIASEDKKEKSSGSETREMKSPLSSDDENGTHNKEFSSGSLSMKVENFAESEPNREKKLNFMTYTKGKSMSEVQSMLEASLVQNQTLLEGLKTLNYGNSLPLQGLQLNNLNQNFCYQPNMLSMHGRFENSNPLMSSLPFINQMSLNFGLQNQEFNIFPSHATMAHHHLKQNRLMPINNENFTNLYLSGLMSSKNSFNM